MSTAPAVAPSLSSSTPLTSLPASSIEATPADEIEERYEISDTLDFIRCSQTHIIALQFPDELLPDSVSVYKALRTGLDAETELYILADTTFGRCVGVLIAIPINVLIG